MPRLIDICKGQEIIIKEYVKGDTIFEYVKRDVNIDLFIDQVREMAALAKSGPKYWLLPHEFCCARQLNILRWLRM